MSGATFACDSRRRCTATADHNEDIKEFGWAMLDDGRVFCPQHWPRTYCDLNPDEVHDMVDGDCSWCGSPESFPAEPSGGA